MPRRQDFRTQGGARKVAGFRCGRASKVVILSEHDARRRSPTALTRPVLYLGTIEDASSEDQIVANKLATRLVLRATVLDSVRGGCLLVDRRTAEWTDVAPDRPTLLHFYVTAHDEGEGDAAQLIEQLCENVEPLVAQYGHRAVISALDELSGTASPSVSLH
jgi:hypothetical protein